MRHLILIALCLTSCKPQEPAAAIVTAPELVPARPREENAAQKVVTEVPSPVETAEALPPDAAEDSRKILAQMRRITRHEDRELILQLAAKVSPEFKEEARKCAEEFLIHDWIKRGDLSDIKRCQLLLGLIAEYETPGSKKHGRDYSLLQDKLRQASLSETSEIQIRQIAFVQSFAMTGNYSIEDEVNKGDAALQKLWIQAPRNIEEALQRAAVIYHRSSTGITFKKDEENWRSLTDWLLQWNAGRQQTGRLTLNDEAAYLIALDNYLLVPAKVSQIDWAAFRRRVELAMPKNRDDIASSATWCRASQLISIPALQEVLNHPPLPVDESSLKLWSEWNQAGLYLDGAESKRAAIETARKAEELRRLKIQQELDEIKL